MGSGNPSSDVVQQMLQQWESEMGNLGYDPRAFLTKLAEIIEQDTELFMKVDPDPFDDRHPSRIDPTCSLGYNLRLIFRKENFITRLVRDYTRDNFFRVQTPGDNRTFELNTVACRLLLDIMPGLDSEAVFMEMDHHIMRLFTAAENAQEPLRSYATGLLGAAMEVSGIALHHREQNSRLVPLLLQRLHGLQEEHFNKLNEAKLEDQRPFEGLARSATSPAHTTSASQGMSSPKYMAMSPPQSVVRSPMSPPPQGAMSPVRVISPSSLSPMSPPRSSTVQDEHSAEARNPVPSTSFHPPFFPFTTHPSRSTVVLDESAVAAAPVRQAVVVRKSPVVNGGSEGASPSSAVVSPAMSPRHESAVASCSSDGLPRALPATTAGDCSNSSWAEKESYMIGSLKMHPLTLSTQQILILRYLQVVGGFQEFLAPVFENNALVLVLAYINLNESKDARLAFEALKYLSSLLCHKKFSTEFATCDRMKQLLSIHRPSIAASGVAMCLYHISYCDDTMERICQFPHVLIKKMVEYLLWLLECSYDSSRCHAIMFLILALPFQTVLNEFDAQDGIRKVYNVVGTQRLVASADNVTLNEDDQCASRQIIRHSFMCLKNYFETHLAIRTEVLRQTESKRELAKHGLSAQQAIHAAFITTTPPWKPVRPSPEQVQENVDTLMRLMNIEACWRPVDKFLKLGGVALLLKVIAYAYEWNYSGRAETVRSALDTLAVCTVIAKAQLQLCLKVDIPRDNISMGMNIITGAAEGEIVNDADLQRSALNVIGNCVCAPEHRVAGLSGRHTSPAKREAAIRQSEKILEQMWDSVRLNNGIMVLLKLITQKTRITEADSIRMLACKALAGLARSSTVQQIIGELPFITDGQLQLLMREPVLQDHIQEHVQFQKYASQLLERVCGKAGGLEFEASLANIYRLQNKNTFQDEWEEGEEKILYTGSNKGVINKFPSDYLFISVGIQSEACSDVEHTFHQVGKFKKRKRLEIFLQGKKKSIVFVEEKRTADFIATYLSDKGLPSTSVHGDRSQRQREEALLTFKSGSMKVLVATAVAAKGNYMTAVENVLNYDLPKHIDEYVLRIGCTARVGNCSNIHSFYDSEVDWKLAPHLLRILEGAEQNVPEWLQQDASGGATINQKQQICHRWQ